MAIAGPTTAFRVLARLEQARNYPTVWRALSLTKALALALLALPSTWPLRLDASSVTMARGGQYADLMGAAIQAASELGTRTLLFDPDVRFPQATTYEVEIPAGTKSQTGGTLKEAVSFSFETPAPTIVSHSPGDWLL